MIFLNNSSNFSFESTIFTFKFKSFQVCIFTEKSHSSIKELNSNNLKYSKISSFLKFSGTNLKSSKSKVSKFIDKSIVASFKLKKAFSLEFTSFSKVFHLKQDWTDFSKSENFFSQEFTFSTSS